MVVLPKAVVQYTKAIFSKNNKNGDYLASQLQYCFLSVSSQIHVTLL